MKDSSKKERKSLFSFQWMSRAYMGGQGFEDTVFVQIALACVCEWRGGKKE